MDTLDSDSSLNVLVVDDDATWVETLVARFQNKSIGAKGVSAPTEMFKWTSDRFTDVDMIFLDMRLGVSKAGVAITAADVLLHLMTYSPTAKVVVFTQEEITVRECVLCIQLGALGIIPKTSDVDHLILVAKVYRHVGDEQKAREQRIRSLWAKLEEDRDDAAKGRQLEMLTINIFNSIDGFEVVSHNREILAGELDLVVENRGKDQFWKELNSFHFVIECKNERSPTEKKEFNVLAQKVIAKQGCTVGILVSMAGASSGFQDLQTAGTDRVTKIFQLTRTDLSELVRRPASGREEYLRRALSRQL